MRRLAVGFVLVAVVALSVAASVAAGQLDGSATAAAPQAIDAVEAPRCAALRSRLALAKRRGQRARVRALTRSLRQCLRRPPPPPPPPKPGQSAVFPANCKYGLAPYPGYLRVSTRPPNVTGTSSRPGAEWVRYAAWLVDSAGNTVSVTSWSGWLAAGDGAWATWTGETSFTADWRGNYRIDFRIEWWDQSSRLAWQVRRVTDYYYFDEWNTAWGGPFPSCMRQPV
jgi:hypothetical protein